MIVLLHKNFSPTAQSYVVNRNIGRIFLFRVDPSFRALSGRLKFTVRRHKFNKDSLSLGDMTQDVTGDVPSPREGCGLRV